MRGSVVVVYRIERKTAIQDLCFSSPLRFWNREVLPKAVNLELENISFDLTIKSLMLCSRHNSRRSLLGSPVFINLQSPKQTLLFGNLTETTDILLVTVR